MSRTHCESGERASIHSSDGTEEVANLSRVDGAAGPVPSSVTCAEPSLSVGSNNWATAEGAAHEIIRKISPTSVSEKRRRDVIDYIQRLIKNCLCFQVLPYGSVPLKTYLPDGDIDLTVFGGANVEDLLADDMKFVLEEEEKNPMAEYVVKDVQVIHAEVKLVKCIVQNIVVDISFNQIGGLCTLCFLEQIDRFIGKDHLFKRSIILIKAWCYYESRILGAHHGLISTYALETLVLYIFHIYHSTLDGPLAVLYKFLEYFSKFDWETYCITLSGPVRLSSLPAIVVEMPEDSCGDLLLTSDFFSSCVDMFSVPSRGGEKSSRGFQQKHLNIIDPLKETNNLGRSVSKGNFYRVRSAFTYGARKLRQILLQPENAIPNELHKFFSNTMARHGERQMPDVQDFDPSLTCNGPIPKVPISESGLCRIDKSMSEECKEYTVLTGDPRSTSGLMANGEQAGIFVSKHSTLSKLISPSHRFHGDANDLATSGLGGLTISNDSSTCQTPTLIDKVNSAGMPYHAPHLYFAHSKLHNGSMKDGNPDSDKLNKCEKTSALVLSGSNGVIISADESLEKSQSVDKDEVAASCKQKDVHLSSESSSFSRDLNRQWASTTRSGTSESLNSLTGLSGDYDSYFRCLQYGRSCYEYSSGLHSLHMPPSPTAPYQIINPWDGAPPPMQFNQNGFSNQHHNGFHSSQHMYAMPHLLIPGMTFGWEEMPKPRGTGTYFPNMNQSPQGYRPSSITGRNKASSRPHYNHGRSMAYSEPSMLDRASHEQLQSHVPGSADSFQSFSPRGNGFHKANGSIIHADGVVEFGSVDHAPGTPTSEKSKQQKSESSSPRNSSVMQKSQLPLSREKDRISLRSSYRLKDEEDFPPLSV